jgi:hypothetical protein
MMMTSKFRAKAQSSPKGAKKMLNTLFAPWVKVFAPLRELCGFA